MSRHILVCPFRNDVLSRLRGRALVVRTGELGEIPRVAGEVRGLNSPLHCVMAYSGGYLSDVPFQEDWQGIPIALSVKGIGHFPGFANKLTLMRLLNLRVYITLGRKESYTDLRILSSLGIASTAVFGVGGVDWEALGDLMVYALLGRVPHAPVEPFHYIAEHYEAGRRTDFGSVYFDDPERYLHVSDEGFVALSTRDLAAGRFIAEDASQLDLGRCPAYTERLGAWKELFLRRQECSFCQGWRVCLGKFLNTQGHPGCREFFVELMEVVEQYKSMQEDRKQLWQA
jgi:hypothetical protein